MLWLYIITNETANIFLTNFKSTAALWQCHPLLNVWNFSAFKALANTYSLPVPRCDFLFKKYTGRVPIIVVTKVVRVPGTETLVKKTLSREAPMFPRLWHCSFLYSRCAPYSTQASLSRRGRIHRGSMSTTCTGVSVLETNQWPGVSSRSFHNPGSKGEDSGTVNIWKWNY